MSLTKKSFVFVNGSCGFVQCVALPDEWTGGRGVGALSRPSLSQRAVDRILRASRTIELNRCLRHFSPNRGLKRSIIVHVYRTLKDPLPEGAKLLMRTREMANF